MKVRDVIDYLKDKDPESEFVIEYSYNTRAKINLTSGYYVTDLPESDNGYFVNDIFANQIQQDGKKFLDFSSPLIVPAVAISSF